MVSIGERLREERERIGLNQTEFSEVGGVTKKTQGLYEKGERSPTADYLASVGKIGVDISYVVEGNQTVTPTVAVSDPLENALLGNFRQMSVLARDHLTALSRMLSESQPAVAERQAPYSVQSDTGPLQQVIAAVEEILIEEQMTLLPDAKARVIAACLESVQKEGGEVTASQISTAIRAVK